MLRMPSLTPFAAKAMSPTLINHLSAICAPMWQAKRDTYSLSFEPTAILMVSSSTRSPTVEFGQALSHAPDSGTDAAMRRTLDLAFDMLGNNACNLASTLGKFQLF